jgi:hypothetical protein
VRINIVRNIDPRLIFSGFFPLVPVMRYDLRLALNNIKTDFDIKPIKLLDGPVVC